MSTFRTQNLFARVSIALHHEIRGRQREVFHPALPADGRINMTDHVTLVKELFLTGLCAVFLLYGRGILLPEQAVPPLSAKRNMLSTEAETYL